MVTIDSYAELGDSPRLPLASACTALMTRQYRAQFGVNRRYEIDTCKAISSFLDEFDPRHDAFWIVRRPGEADGVLGCAAVDGSARQVGRNFAMLRWVMLSEALRGRGLGRRLVDLALAFCRRQAFRHVTLQTHAALRAAVHLYEQRGFRYTGEDEILDWGPPLRMRRYVLDLRAAAQPQHAAMPALAA
jgi:GNAT superfamily N-acetyltransferase